MKKKTMENGWRDGRGKEAKTEIAAETDIETGRKGGQKTDIQKKSEMATGDGE